MTVIRVLVLASTLLSFAPARAQTRGRAPGADGQGSASAFLRGYLAFRDRQRASGAPDRARVALGFVKGISTAFTGTGGSFGLDLRSGAWTADLTGLAAGERYVVALLDRGEGATPDRRLELTTLTATGATASAQGTLSSSQAAGFVMDRVIVAPAASPDAVLSSGGLSVFQKLFFRRQSLVDTVAPSRSFTEPAAPLPLSSLVPPVLAAGAVPVDNLVRQGARLFNTETFGGNGRTCATCHPASNNFTIDSAFIATLPQSDPLFVAENVPALAQLERPQLMRQFGLILENLDGLDDPTNKFVMRSVPHTLGMTVSLAQDAALAGAPAQMTGWSGDGAPGAGALRDFATGAVTQHFPRSLSRVPGVDFVLPSEHQLDAMEAFQLSLGRDADLDLTRLTFQDPGVEAGKNLFVNGTGNPAAGGRCAGCHGNSGALAGNGQNRNFNTNVEDLVNPARAVQPFPIDGGFGLQANPDGSFGNRTFNTSPVVEAADTAPFFHSNAVATLEGVVEFYGGPVFNGPRAPSAQFSFDATQVTQLANFMRGINTLQNVDVARRELAEILAFTGNPQPEVQARLQTALLETGDALRVLGQTGIFPAAATQITTAQQRIVQAQGTNNPNQRRTIIQQAIAALDAARPLVATVTP